MRWVNVTLGNSEVIGQHQPAKGLAHVRRQRALLDETGLRHMHVKSESWKAGDQLTSCKYSNWLGSGLGARKHTCQSSNKEAVLRGSPRSRDLAHQVLNPQQSLQYGAHGS